MWFTAGLTEPLVEQSRCTFASTDPEGYARTCDVLAEVDLRDRVAGWTMPTVVVCGDDDASAFRDAAEWLAVATGANDVHWLPGRHACAVEHPKKFAELVATTAS
jgi:3-oxoadipate enol-lactonase